MRAPMILRHEEEVLRVMSIWFKMVEGFHFLLNLVSFLFLFLKGFFVWSAIDCHVCLLQQTISVDAECMLNLVLDEHIQLCIQAGFVKA